MTFPFSENTLTDLGFISKYFGLTQQETSWIKEIDYNTEGASNIQKLVGKLTVASDFLCCLNTNMAVSHFKVLKCNTRSIFKLDCKQETSLKKIIVED